MRRRNQEQRENRIADVQNNVASSVDKMGLLSAFLGDPQGCRYFFPFDEESQDLKSVALSELAFGVVLVVPTCLLAALLTKRFVISTHRSNFTSALLFVLVGDLLLFLWLPPSLECLSDVSPERNQAVCLLTAIRLLCVYVGAYIGQSFVPIALTGSIACGKSTVAEMLLEDKAGTSFMIIDTDKIGHEILVPPSVIEENRQDYSISPDDSVFLNILADFGDKEVDYKNILDEDERIDRNKLGAIIFQDPAQRRKLNRVTHPQIMSCMLKQIAYNIYMGRPHKLVCADVPLLFESGKLAWLFAINIVVVCNPDLQLARLRKRNPDLKEQQCKDRIASQFPVEKKAALSDTVIWNNGSVEDLQKEVARVRIETEKRLRGPVLTLSRYVLVAGGIALASFCYIGLLSKTK